MTLTAVLLTTLLGIGATVVMDLWALLLKSAGQPTLNLSMIGRWTGHMLHGQFIHRPTVAQSPPVRNENALGWFAHYAIGIIFAFIFIFLTGEFWFLFPSFWPAYAWGVITVAAPYFIMQPAMGAGIAASRTPNPAKARLMSFLSHSAYGAGLYLTGLALHPLITGF